MDAILSVKYSLRPPFHSVHFLRRPSVSGRCSFQSFRALIPSSSCSPSFTSLSLPSSRKLCIKASSKSSSFSSSSSSFSLPSFFDSDKLKDNFFKTLSQSIPPSLLRTTLIAGIAFAAVFFARFQLRPVISCPNSPCPPIETTTHDDGEQVSEDDRQSETVLEERLRSSPDDVEALARLMLIKTKKWEVPEAISILERLIRLEPDYIEWKLVKAHLHCNAGEFEDAKVGFREVLERDPLRVEAYHGLVVAAAVADSSSEMTEIGEKLEKGMEICYREGKKDVWTSMNLLMAQIRVLEGNYDEGLKIYQALVAEEPNDFRPYLCQGILYSLLKKKKEAEECLEKFRGLVPEGHPLAEQLDYSVLFP